MALPKIIEWRPVPLNTRLGFVKVEFPCGLIINDVTILTAERGPWAAAPSKPMVGRDGTVMKDERGKVRYVAIIEFASKEIHNKWSDSIIKALRETHPEALQ